MVPCESHGTIRTAHTTYTQRLGVENHMLQLNIYTADDGLMYPKHVELRIHQ